MITCPQYRTGFYAPKRGGVPLYPELWRGCVGAWAPCLGPTGLTLRDWSGFENHGTLTNGPVSGVSGGQQAITFDGSNDSVDATFASPSLGVLPFTISVWCRFTTPIGSFKSVVTIGHHPASQWLLCCVEPGGKFQLQMFNGIGNPYISSTTTPTVDRWYHFVCMRRNNQLLLFIDGRNEASMTDSTSIANQPILTIGNFSGYSSSWPGQISDVMVHRTAITNSQVRLLASRPGIAYELAPRRTHKVSSGNRRRRFLIGAH